MVRAPSRSQLALSIGRCWRRLARFGNTGTGRQQRGLAIIRCLAAEALRSSAIDQVPAALPWIHGRVCSLLAEMRSSNTYNPMGAQRGISFFVRNDWLRWLTGNSPCEGIALLHKPRALEPNCRNCRVQPARGCYSPNSVGAATGAYDR